MKTLAQSTCPVTRLAFTNKEQVHRMTMEGLDNEDRVHRFRCAFEDELPADQLTDRAVISAMCAVELECYS